MELFGELIIIKILIWLSQAFISDPIAQSGKVWLILRLGMA